MVLNGCPFLFYLETTLTCPVKHLVGSDVLSAGQVLSAAMNAEEELSHFTISTRRRGAERREGEGGIADLLNENIYTL